VLQTLFTGLVVSTITEQNQSTESDSCDEQGGTPYLIDEQWQKNQLTNVKTMINIKSRILLFHGNEVITRRTTGKMT